MYFLRALVASLLSLLCTLAVSAFVTLQTVNATLLSRAEVKTWLAESGTYDRLLPTLLTSDPTTQQHIASLGHPALQEATHKALVQTFPPSFVQQSSERVLDGVYNWIDGRQPDIQFEINTTAYKAAFIQNMTAQLEPQLAKLPRCTALGQFDANSPACLPPGTSASQAAEAMAVNAANQALIFTQPINTDNYRKFITNSTNQGGSTPADLSSNLPQAVSTMRQWLLWLPIIALLCGILMVLFSQHKLKAGKYLAGRLTVGLALTCAAGILVANLGQAVNVSDYTTGMLQAGVAEIVEPIVRQAAPAIGYHLAWVSGSMAALTLIAWIVLRVIKQRRDRVALLQTEGNHLPALIDTQPPTTPPGDTPSKPASP